MHPQGSEQKRAMLLVRAAEWHAALPIADVVETCRPLPLRPIQGVPAYVRGMTVLRGKSTPVLSLGGLLAGGDARPGRRLVSLRLPEGVVALEVDEVYGVHDIAESQLDGARPLLGGEALDRVSGTAIIDEKLVAWLETGRLVQSDLLDLLFAENLS